jgi:LuxR family maltose regulon positive regulatory protein
MNLTRFEEAMEECRAAIALFEALPPSPASSHVLSGCYFNMGLTIFLTARFSGVHTGAEYFIRANYYHMRHPRTFKSPATKPAIPSYIAQVAYPARAGEFEEAIENLAAAVPHAANCFGGFLSGMDDLARAEICYFRDDLNNAELHARQAIFRAHEKEQYTTETRALFYLLRISLHTGDRQGLEEIWKQLEASLEIQEYVNLTAVNDLIRSWFYAQTGDAERVAPWLRNEFIKNENSLMFHNLEILVKAKYLCAAKQHEAALALLGPEENRQGLESYLLGMLEINCLEAVIRRRTGDLAGALSCLERAWEASLSNEIFMPFIEQGDEMRLLVSDALNSGTCAIPEAWLESARSRASAYGKKLTLVREYSRTAEGAETGAEPVYLTRQEKKILALLSQGFNREEIAGKLMVSGSHVKSGIRGIYQKLGAINRADAIRIASNLKFL